MKRGDGKGVVLAGVRLGSLILTARVSVCRSRVAAEHVFPYSPPIPIPPRVSTLSDCTWLQWSIL